jgi:hypothetical protein
MTMSSNPNSPTFVHDHLPLHWQMTRCEKYCFASLVEYSKSEVAIEIGTYKGGSLQVISAHAKKVYSLDIDPGCKEQLGHRFPNVDFRTGDSKQMIAAVLENIRRNGEKLGFVLIDGDHTTDGVRGDINAVLNHVPERPVYVVFHDSFHPQSREGILQADWLQCPYVHFVEVDFIPGVFHYHAFDTAEPRSMYGGLAVALMLPEKRESALAIHESQRGLFDTVLQHSCHVPPRQQEVELLTRIRKKLGSVKRRLIGR